VIIGLPKEIKDNEYRVGLTPAGVRAKTPATTSESRLMPAQVPASRIRFINAQVHRSWIRLTKFGPAPK
jgi:hypothetical protein